MIQVKQCFTDSDPHIAVLPITHLQCLQGRPDISCELVEKAVKRNYVKTFDGWNSQSFAESYSMSKGKAYCRYAYKDIVEDTRRIAAKLGALK